MKCSLKLASFSDGTVKEDVHKPRETSCSFVVGLGERVSCSVQMISRCLAGTESEGQSEDRVSEVEREEKRTSKSE